MYFVSLFNHRPRLAALSISLLGRLDHLSSYTFWEEVLSDHFWTEVWYKLSIYVKWFKVFALKQPFLLVYGTTVPALIRRNRSDKFCTFTRRISFGPSHFAFLLFSAFAGIHIRNLWRGQMFQLEAIQKTREWEKVFLTRFVTILVLCFNISIGISMEVPTMDKFSHSFPRETWEK